MRRLMWVLGACLWVIPACDRTRQVGPPDIRPGRDECRECGMIIADVRCSSALIADRDGRRESTLFDDIGCMLDAEREHAAEFRIMGRFVHDYSTRAWVEADSAVFLLADRGSLPTPMGSGIGAFADRAQAEEARERLGGKVLDYAGLKEARRSRMEERRGAPGG
jgi:nitrous oxide reductase accessory protein NosL